MKKIVFGYLISALAILCSLTTFAKVTISGTIEEPAAFQRENGIEQAPIKFYVTFMVEQREFTAIPNEKGYFTLEIPINQPSEAYFEYVDHTGYLFLMPGNYLQIKFHNGDFSRKLSYSGSGSEHNNYLAEFQRIINLEKLADELYIKRQKLTESEYKLHCENLQFREQAILDLYLERHRTSAFFQEWAKAEIEYRCANRIHQYYFRSYDKMNDGYPEFMMRYDLTNVTALMSKEYRRFLEYHLRNLTMRDPFQISLEKSGSTQPWVIRAYQLAQQEYSGVVLDYALANLVNILLIAKHSSAESIYTDFINRPSGTELKPALMEKFQPVQEVFSAVLPANSRLSIANQENQLSLQEILNQYLGKVVYIDFWAGWCKPCLAEMKHSVALQKKYADKDVVFLFFSQDFSDGTWRGNIAKYQIGGEHYLMDKKLKEETGKEYIIVELPRYVLLNKNGEVAHEFANRPSSAAIHGDIDALLGQ